MKRFVIKFLVVIFLFFIPAAFCKFYVIPNMSGDIGQLGMIPFGKEYDGLDVPEYQRSGKENARVFASSPLDSLALFRVVTVGDSFSQQGQCGYQWKLSTLFNCPIANYVDRENNVFNRYLRLLNSGYINKGQTVIVECVERSLVARLSRMDFDSRFPSAQNKDLQISEDGKSSVEPFLNRFFSWIRLNLNVNNPILKFKLNKQCFTHSRFGNTLHIYNSSKDFDGDLLWELNNETDWSRAEKNMFSLIDISKQHGVNLVILIAADRYDAYEPWIVEGHPINPTLDRIPSHQCVFNTKPYLQKAIRDGVLDVYKVNNTHWSVVGADIVADSLFNWVHHLSESENLESTQNN